MEEVLAFLRSPRSPLARDAAEQARLAGLEAEGPQLEAAWRRTFDAFEDAVAVAADRPELVAPLDAATDYRRHPLAATAIEVARRHHARGVQLTAFLTLLKRFRRVLQLALARSGSDEAMQGRLDQVCDIVEMGVVADWSEANGEGRLRELAAASRRAVAERLKYLTVFESLAAPALILDAADRIEHANAAALRTFTGDAVGGEGYYDRRVPKPLVEQVGNLLEAAAAEEPLTLPTLKGLRRFLVTARRLMTIDERAAGRAILLTDITSYADGARAVATTHGDATRLMAILAHELRTPLNAVLGGIELLDADLESARGHPALATVRRAGQILADLAAQALDGAAGDAPRALVPVAVPLQDALEAALDLVRPRAKAKGLALTLMYELPPSLDILSDEAKLQRILINLLDNAVKFTARGVISCRAYAGDEDRTLTIEVADTGPGLDRQALSLIFEPFVRLGAASDAEEGVGLGLAIARDLAATLGGSLEAESRPGHGSRFRLTLPLTATKERHPGTRPEVLVVDDDEANGLVAEGLLTHAGFAVRIAGTTADAWRAVRQAEPAAVLVDLRLPDVDGIALIAQVRRHWPELPLVVYSANAGDGRAARHAGANAVLQKPDDLRRMPHVLRGLVIAGAGNPQTAALPALDRRRLDGHAGALGRAGLARVAAALRRSAEAAQASVAAAAAGTAAVDEAAQRLHALAGGAAQLGLPILARRSAGLEVLAVADDRQALAAECADFAEETARALADLDRLIASLPTTA